MALTTDLSDHIMTITFNRPEALNAIDPETRAELNAAWEEFRTNDDAWVAILTGAGDRAFCVGSDLKKTPPPDESFAGTKFSSRGADELWRPLENLWKPIIAAINGHAYGGGLELALHCDLRIASENATFAQSEVRVGSMVGAGGSIRLMRAIPQAAAMKMLLTGMKIDVAEALRLGLVSDVVPLGGLAATARDLAETICRNAPLSIRATKMAAVMGQGMTPAQGLELERLLWGILRNTEDRIEGRRAFSEKRAPDWRAK